MSDKFNLVITEPEEFSSSAETLLKNKCDIFKLTDGLPGKDDQLSFADILWVRLKYKIDQNLMGSAPKLKCIVSPTTGLNHIDLDTAADRNIKILSLKGEYSFLKNIKATAEHTIALILALYRKIPKAYLHVKNGGWNRDLFKGNEIFNKVIGIIGYGRIGQIVSDYFLAFGAKVLIYDIKPAVIPENKNVIFSTLDEVLSNADIITLHVNYSKENDSFFDMKMFSRMKPSAVFINTARGELVDEDALIDALQLRFISGAAIDVLRDEQNNSGSKNKLIKYLNENENLIVTPHLGGCTHESMSMTEEFMAQKLVYHLDNC